MTTNADAELLSTREGSQDYDMEEDDSDILLKTLEELEQIVPVVESNDWRAETCQKEESEIPGSTPNAKVFVFASFERHGTSGSQRFRP